MKNRSPWWLKALAAIATLFALAVQAQGGVLTLRQVKGSAITNAEYDSNWVESYSAVAHGFSVGTLVYKSGASSWAKAIATASSTFADGVVVAVPDANTAYISVHFGQPFTKTAHGLGAAGTDVYLSDSVAGNMTASTTDQLIGQVLDANTVLFGAMGGGGGAGFSGSYTGAVTFDGDVATNLDVDNTHATDANFKNIFIGRREGNIRFFLNGTGLDEGEIGLRGPTGNDRWKCYHTTTASECDFKEADGTTSSSIGSILGSYSWNGRDVVGGSHYVYNSDGAELELTGTDVKVSAGADLLIADLTASECVATDSNKRLVSTGSPCGAGGGGDSITVNATAATDAKFLDGDIDWSINTAATPDEITATVACTGCVDATDVAGLDAGDTTTGTFADARIDGSAEADEVNPTLGSQTQGNYVSSATSGGGLTLAGTEGASLGIRTDCGIGQAPIWDGDSWECGTGGALNVNTTTVGNVTTGEDDLITYSLPGGTLATNGDAITIEAFGTFGSVSEAKTVRCYFGATQLITFDNLGATPYDWRMSATVIRTGAATQRAAASIVYIRNATTSGLSDYTTPTETLSGAVTIKCTGEATTTDEVQQTGLLVYRPGGSGGSGGGGSITLDIGDDGGNDSTALAELSDLNNRHGELSEPSADEAQFDWSRVGGFGEYNPDRKPTTGVSFYESWANNTAAATWAWGNQGGASETIVMDGATLTVPASALNIRARWTTGPAGSGTDFLLAMKVANAGTAQFNTAALALLVTGTEATPTLMEFCKFYTNGIGDQHFIAESHSSYTSGPTAHGSSLALGVNQTSDVYLAMKYISSTKALSCWQSQDGRLFMQYGTTATLASHPTTSMGFMGAAVSAGTGFSMHVQWIEALTGASQISNILVGE